MTDQDRECLQLMLRAAAMEAMETAWIPRGTYGDMLISLLKEMLAQAKERNERVNGKQET